MFLRQKPQCLFFLILLPGLLRISILQPAIAQEKPKPENPYARWESTIAKFEEQDKNSPPAKGGVLFVGSSSIRLWKLDESFPDLGAINRGFGGSEIADSTHFAQRIILKHEPRLIFLYAGDNDIAKGKSAETVTEDFQKLAKVVRMNLPETRLVFIAIKPSIKRWALADVNAKANAAILEICQQDDLLGFADIWKPMLGEDSKPRPELFAKDGLHLNDDGYKLWTSIVKPHIVPVEIGASYSAAGAQGVRLVHYEASDKPGELSIDSTFYLWTPPRATIIRGLIVHQHGCGEGASTGGQTAAYDLHWQALAKKWNFGLVGSNYGNTDNCSDWYDPDKGSRRALKMALAHFAQQTGHPEIIDAPWALWGHSGGSVWAFRMFDANPERCIAVWLRSGRPTIFEGSEVGTVTELTEAKKQVPVVCNCGLKEKDDQRFHLGWDANRLFFETWRPQGALLTWAPDPKTNHECGNSRYLAIPYFDEVIRQRLPGLGSSGPPLKPAMNGYWEGHDKTFEISHIGKHEAEPHGSWLPSESVARIWQQFVRKGEVADETPPETAPEIVLTSVGKKTEQDKRAIMIRWEAVPDFESGIREFIVLRNGEEIGRVSHEKTPRFGIAQLQQLSYHDTPERPLPAMRLSTTIEPGENRFRVVTVNGAGLKSKPSNEVLISGEGEEVRDSP